MDLSEYRTHYILACNLQMKEDIKNLDSHICSKFIKGYGTKIWRASIYNNEAVLFYRRVCTMWGVCFG